MCCTMSITKQKKIGNSQKKNKVILNIFIHKAFKLRESLYFPLCLYPGQLNIYELCNVLKNVLEDCVGYKGAKHCILFLIYIFFAIFKIWECGCACMRETE